LSVLTGRRINKKDTKTKAAFFTAFIFVSIPARMTDFLA